MQRQLLPPDPQDLILATRCHRAAIRAPVNGIHLIGMTWQVHFQLLRRYIPDLHEPDSVQRLVVQLAAL